MKYPHCEHCVEGDELLGGTDKCQDVMEDHGFPCLRCGQGKPEVGKKK